jgi:hypothetical protein
MGPGSAAHHFMLRCVRDASSVPPSHPDRDPQSEPIALRRGRERLGCAGVDPPRDRRAGKRVEKIVCAGTFGRSSFDAAARESGFDQETAP